MVDADSCEDHSWQEPNWPAHACEEIDLDHDTAPPGRERGRLQRVLEDAERTIQLVRQGNPPSASRIWNDVLSREPIL
jgi:hypothetical protein